MQNEIRITYNKKYKITNFIITSFFILILIMPEMFPLYNLINKKTISIQRYLITFIYLIFMFICCNILLKRILWINKCEIVLDDEKVKLCYLKKRYKKSNERLSTYMFAPFTDGSHSRSYIRVLENDIIYYGDITDCYMTKHDINIITNGKKYKIEEEQFNKEDLEKICNEINKKIK